MFIRVLVRPWPWRSKALRSFAAMLTLAPTRVPPQARIADAPVPGSKGRVALLQGCAEPVLRPEYRQAAVRLLNRAGYDVLFAPGEVCCGALVHHMGREGEGRDNARRNVDAWQRLIDEGGLDAILVTASGCGSMIKEYGRSEEHTSELQSLMRISYAVFCL